MDLDGVLNSAAYDRKRDWSKQTYIDETRLPLLKRIVEKTGAKIVFNSTWREHWDKRPQLCDEEGKYIEACFKRFGLEIYDKTPDLGILAERGEEISAWLSLHEKVENFVILDDYPYGFGALRKYLVKTDPRRTLGLEEEQAERAVEMLNRH